MIKHRNWFNDQILLIKYFKINLKFNLRLNNFFPFYLWLNLLSKIEKLSSIKFEFVWCRSRCLVVHKRALRNCKRIPRDQIRAITTKVTASPVPVLVNSRNQFEIASCWAHRACRNPVVRNSPLFLRLLITAKEELALDQRTRHFRLGYWNRQTAVSAIHAVIMPHLIFKVTTAHPIAPIPLRGWDTAILIRPADGLKVIWLKYKIYI